MKGIVTAFAVGIARYSSDRIKQHTTHVTVGKRNKWQIVHMQVRVTRYLLQAYQPSCLKCSSCSITAQDACTHMQTYLFVSKSFYETTLLDSLLLFIKGKCGNIPKFDICKYYATLINFPWKHWECSHLFPDAHSTYLIDVELRLPPRQFSVTCCEFSNEIMAV